MVIRYQDYVDKSYTAHVVRGVSVSEALKNRREEKLNGSILIPLLHHIENPSQPSSKTVKSASFFQNSSRKNNNSKTTDYSVLLSDLSQDDLEFDLPSESNIEPTSQSNRTKPTNPPPRTIAPNIQPSSVRFPLFPRPNPGNSVQAPSTSTTPTPYPPSPSQRSIQPTISPPKTNPSFSNISRVSKFSNVARPKPAATSTFIQGKAAVVPNTQNIHPNMQATPPTPSGEDELTEEQKRKIEANRNRALMLRKQKAMLSQTVHSSFPNTFG